MIPNGAAPCDHSASICRRSQQVRYVISWWYRQSPFRVYVGWYRIYLPLSKFQKGVVSHFDVQIYVKIKLPLTCGTCQKTFLCSLEASMDNESWIRSHKLSFTQAFNTIEAYLSYSVISKYFCWSPDWMSIFFPWGLHQSPLGKAVFPPPKLQAATGLRNRIHWSRRRHGSILFFLPIRKTSNRLNQKHVRKSEGWKWKRKICHVNLVEGMVSGIISPSNGNFLRCSSSPPPPPKKWWSWQHLLRFNTEISVGKCMKHTGYENDIHSLKNGTWILFGDSHT